MAINPKKLRVYLAILAIFAFIASATAQDFEKIQIETVKVTERIYMLVGGGGNIGVSAGEDGVLLIDDQFGQLMEKIKAAISKISDRPIRLVLNTNWHYDHVSGNELLGKSGALIISHENSRKLMMVEQSYPEFNTHLPPYPEAALPALTFKDALTLYFNGDEIQVTHIPHAHSDADIVIYFRKANVIHTGDLCFSSGYPFIDVIHGGSTNGMVEAADTILKMIDANTKLIPGHGPLTNREGLQKFRDMLAAVRDRIAKLVKEGKTLEEVLASKPTADFDKDWHTGMQPELFVKIVYNDLFKLN
jgi:glyoxylase-like metal-dependent hydrolase (beta-lactamase superfamily II)